MFVVNVTPLTRNSQLESLSYFSQTEYPIGSFLEVPIRGKKQRAIVTDTKPVSSTKTALKAATFSLRKLPNQLEPPQLPETTITLAKALSEKYPIGSGTILFSLLPPDIRNGSHPYPQIEVQEHHEESTPQILSARIDERLVEYQSLIRSTFAHHGSLLLVAPTGVDVKYFSKKLSQGITDRVVEFYPQQTKKQRTASYLKLQDTTTSKLIISTPSHAYLERSDLLAIIIEQSASSQYISRNRPYLDHRDALITYAKLSGRSILLADTVVRTEDEARRRDEIYLTYGEEVKRIAFTAPLSIISQRDKPKPDRLFKVFSDELLVSTERALEARGHVFFYGARRGLAPIVACIDCGYIFRCPDSNTPYSLVRTHENGEEKRWFISSTSGRRIRAADVCEHCGSWRLRERGIGIQTIADEWQNTHPSVETFVLDNTTAKTAAQAQKIIKAYYESPSAMLIGTQLALPFLHEGVDVSAVISLDAARSIPTWRADEYLFRLLLRMREFTRKEVIIQTRTETDNLLTYASRGAVERFFDDEIKLREMVQYPPFSTFILLTWQGSRTAIPKLSEPVKTALESFSPQYYTSPNSTPEKTTCHALLRIPRGHTELYSATIQKLKTLPPYIKTEINPERIV